MIWSEFYTDAWFVFDGVHVPPRIQKSMFLLYKVLAKNLIVIFSGAPPAREARERGRSPIGKEMW